MKNVVAAIGIFDGVHRGHRQILRRAVRRARARRGTPVAVTFYPHPAAVLAPASVPPLILSLKERLEAFGACGIRAVLVIRFTRAFSRWSPEAFVERILVDRLHVKEVVVGHDFGFGAGRKGTIETLRRLGRRWGFQVRVVPPVRLGGRRISSRLIRELIRAGNLGKAAAFLGRPVSVSGRVVPGAGRGRKLGFPTANIRVQSGVFPPVGVYAVLARIGSGAGVYRGMANIGYRPTFRRKTFGGEPLLEVHLFGVARPLYGGRVKIRFLKRLRPEKRFASEQLLTAQLKKDAAQVQRLSTVLKSFTDDGRLW